MQNLKYSILIFTIIIFCCKNRAIAQSTDNIEDNTEFRDTIYQFAFDSLTHHLGSINPRIKGTSYVKKYFTYFGIEPMIIIRAWTGDPHFICDYPKEPLQNGKIYSFTVCFYHSGRSGVFNKRMGFQLMNDCRITFKFTGNYNIPQTNNKD